MKKLPFCKGDLDAYAITRNPNSHLETIPYIVMNSMTSHDQIFFPGEKFARQPESSS
jgi:hypothetical protein